MSPPPPDLPASTSSLGSLKCAAGAGGQDRPKLGCRLVFPLCWGVECHGHFGIHGKT